MTPAEAAALVADHWGIAAAEVEITRPGGGLVNEVVRARGPRESLILKHAPPFVAAVPTVALSPRRLAIEARCLRELGPGGALAGVATAQVRAPHAVAFDAARAVLIMEDVGPLPDLGAAPRIEPHLGHALGSFLARLHLTSGARPDLLAALDNHDVQDTRCRSLYAQVDAWLAARGHPEARVLGAAARAVGNRLRVPGPALIMGDLWLPSLLTDGEAIRVIDWEFAHAGQPAQDLGHLLAHLWMHARMATRARAADLDAVRVQVVTGYAEAGGVLGPAVRQEASRHAGCEMLARIAGPFASRFVFANSAPTSPEVEQAIATASRAIAGEDGPWWS